MGLERSILLVGAMCSGKSTVGKELAQRLGTAFSDTDRLVEARVGPLQPYFDRCGEAAFREREREVLLELLQGPPQVIATGGGAPFHADNMDRMLAAATVLWLEVPLDVLQDRVARKGTDRPLLKGLTGEALRGRVALLLADREAGYARAHIHVAAHDGVDAVVQRAIERIDQDR